jgi:hypothetical protein
MNTPPIKEEAYYTYSFKCKIKPQGGGIPKKKGFKMRQ